MLKKIEGKENLSAQVREFVEEARRMVSRYGWTEKTVMPYSFKMQITDMIDDLSRYDKCGKHSKAILIEEANGLAQIMNSWEAREKEATIKVRLNKTGKIRMITPEEYEETYKEFATVI